MKYLAILLLLSLSACTTKTQFGSCVGINDKEDPKLEYKYSAWNIGVGIIFVETVVTPIVVLLDELKCPVGNK